MCHTNKGGIKKAMFESIKKNTLIRKINIWTYPTVKNKTKIPRLLIYSYTVLEWYIDFVVVTNSFTYYFIQKYLLSTGKVPALEGLGIMKRKTSNLKSLRIALRPWALTHLFSQEILFGHQTCSGICENRNKQIGCGPWPQRAYSFERERDDKQVDNQ